MLLGLARSPPPIDPSEVGLTSLILLGEVVLTSRAARGLDGEGCGEDMVDEEEFKGWLFQ